MRHLTHHYKDFECGFGVTSGFWDKIFGTDFEVGGDYSHPPADKAKVRLL